LITDVSKNTQFCNKKYLEYVFGIFYKKLTDDDITIYYKFL